jgi:ABC-type transport system involved in cytochrome c biogenesis ATPase subunit
VIVVENISHRYGSRVALSNVTFKVNQGEIFGLLGPNGGGKSTLFRILSTMMVPTEGRATVAGCDVVSEASQVRRKVGVVFQTQSLDKALTVGENLRSQGHLHGISGTTLRERMEKVMARLGILDRRNDVVESLSGGLKRRVIRLVATILRKRAASSLAAIRKTVAQRRENISQTIADVEVRRDHLRAVRRGETISEEAQARLERDLYRSYLSAMQRTGRELRRLKDETDRLDQLEQLVAACGAGPEAKLLTLEGWLKALYEQHPEKKVIVFSEYTDTVDTIVTHLEGCGYSGQVVRLTGDVLGNPTPSRGWRTACRRCTTRRTRGFLILLS